MATVKPYTPAVPLQHLPAQSPLASQPAPAQTTQSLPASSHTTSTQTAPSQPAAPPLPTTPPTYHPPTMQPTTPPSASQRWAEWLNSPTPWLCTILSIVFGTLAYKLAVKALVIQVWNAWNDYYSTCQSDADHGKSTPVCDDVLAKAPAPPPVVRGRTPYQVWSWVGGILCFYYRARSGMCSINVRTEKTGED